MTSGYLECIFSKIFILQVLSISTSCLLVGGDTSTSAPQHLLEIETLFDLAAKNATANTEAFSDTGFRSADGQNASGLGPRPSGQESLESLPSPQQLVAEPRNYVAYIPVPINDEDGDEDDEYEYYEDEYDDEEEYDEDDEYYYEEDEDVKPTRVNRRKESKKQIRRPSNNRRRYGDRRRGEGGGKERVPFLVPLMMVPENQVGVQKEFTFSRDEEGEDPTNAVTEELFEDVVNRRVYNQNIGNSNNRRNFRTGPRRAPAGRPVHNVPGPPYRGPPPRNPSLPLGKYISEYNLDLIILNHLHNAMRQLLAINMLDKILTIYR